MPVAMLTSLILWTSLLPSGAGSSECDRASVDRPPALSNPISFPEIRPRADEEPWIWTLTEANLGEEETGEGDPERLGLELSVDLPFGHPLGLASMVQRQYSTLPRPVRSPILRC